MATCPKCKKHVRTLDDEADGQHACPRCGYGDSAEDYRNRFVVLTEVAEAVEALVDVGLSQHGTDEAFIECHLCGDWDGHKTGCPMPLLLVWQEET